MAAIYKKALERRRIGKQFKNLGQVIGVNVKFEENKNTEVIIESNKINPKEAAKIIFEKLENVN